LKPKQREVWRKTARLANDARAKNRPLFIHAASNRSNPIFEPFFGHLSLALFMILP
jgi:hypothetical protein